MGLSHSLALFLFPRQNNLEIPRRTSVPPCNNMISGCVPPVIVVALAYTLLIYYIILNSIDHAIKVYIVSFKMQNQVAWRFIYLMILVTR